MRQEDNLLRIANRSHDYRLTESVIDGLESQARLQQIARSAVLAHTRARAINKIVDEGYLCELLRTETNDFVQENALQKINDIVLLSSLRLTGPQELQTRLREKIRNLSNSG
ncbi:MAG: hypothetical protein IH840_07410 [Candidatus Heimdallarchaeota archaeon]|nr:hypothetical protein [Candidatus Heimdallarchaeota archaeon]